MSKHCIARYFGLWIGTGLIGLMLPQQAGAIGVGLAFSRDGALVATCGPRIRVHEVSSGKLVREIEASGSRSFSQAVAFSPTERDLFAVGSNDGVIRIWRVGEKVAVRELAGHDAGIVSLAFAPDGKMLASGSLSMPRGKPAHGQLRLWDLGSGKEVRSVDFKESGVDGVSFSGDGKLLAICRLPTNAASEVEIYQVQPWERAGNFTLSCGALKGKALGLVTRFAPDGKRLLIGGGVCVPVPPEQASGYKDACRMTGVLWEVDPRDPRSLRQIANTCLGYHRSLSFSPDGKRFATGTMESVDMRDASGKPVWTVPGLKNSNGEAMGPNINGVTISPDGRLVAYCQTALYLLDAATGKVVRVIRSDSPGP